MIVPNLTNMIASAIFARNAKQTMYLKDQLDPRSKAFDAKGKG
jgi:hypothetical protein